LARSYTVSVENHISKCFGKVLESTFWSVYKVVHSMLIILQADISDIRFFCGCSSHSLLCGITDHRCHRSVQPH